MTDPYQSKSLRVVAVLLVALPVLLLTAFVVLSRAAVLMAGGWSFWRSLGIALAVVLGVFAWGLFVRWALRRSRRP